MERERTQLHVKANTLRQLLKQFLQCGEWSLDMVATAIPFEAFLLEIASVLHPFAQVGNTKLFSHRHGSLTRRLSNWRFRVGIDGHCLGQSFRSTLRCTSITNM